MSVLSFPRIYFKGMMSWDPCTFNNNDWQEFPTYDGVNAALNWPFLATQGITPQNFYSTFRPWAIALQPDWLPWPRHKFSGDINGLNPPLTPPEGPFLLASIARFLYPVGCLACERPRP